MSSDEKKRDLFGQLKHLVDIAAGMAEPAPQAPMPSVDKPIGAPPKTAPMTPREPNTNALPPKAAGTDRLQRTAPSTSPLGLEQPVLPEEELSPRRLAMISDFINGQTKLAAMRDPKYMYKVVSDERSYQTQVLRELQMRRAAAEDEAAQAELDGRIKTAQAIIQNLFKVLKHLTGKAGKTGGTNFLGGDGPVKLDTPFDLS